MTEETISASPEDTRSVLLEKAGSGYTVVRHAFTQVSLDGTITGPQAPGILGSMVTSRSRRALQLYLFLLTVWPWLNGRDPLPAAVWARAMRTSTGRQWSVTNVSDTWSELDKLGLISRRRLSRGVVITPLREDRNGQIYTRPQGAKKNPAETYFSLPPRFWTDGLFESLSMPALAMLLIVAARTSREEETRFTNKQAAEWYGLSARSVEGGLADLVKAKVLIERTEWVSAPLSAIGMTKQHWYSLAGEFSTQARIEMQSNAQAERAKRTKSATNTGGGTSSAPSKSSGRRVSRAATGKSRKTASTGSGSKRRVVVRTKRTPTGSTKATRASTGSTRRTTPPSGDTG